MRTKLEELEYKIIAKAVLGGFQIRKSGPTGFLCNEAPIGVMHTAARAVLWYYKWKSADERARAIEQLTFLTTENHVWPLEGLE
jgi:hypothetical protein